MSSLLRSRTAFIFTVVLACLALMPSGARATREHPDDAYRESSDIGKMFHKLGRGLTNTLFGWIELPKSIAAEWRHTDPFTGTLVGAVKGVGWTIARTLDGLYEVVSFPFPVPRDYEPIMFPEFVLPTIWGDRLPLFRDEYMAAEGATGAVVDYGRSPTGNTNVNVNSSTMVQTRSY